MNIITSVFDIFIVSPAYHYINAKRQSISDVNLPLLISAQIWKGFLFKRNEINLY